MTDRHIADFITLRDKALKAFARCAVALDTLNPESPEAGMMPFDRGGVELAIEAFIFDAYRAYRLVKGAEVVFRAASMDVDDFLATLATLEKVRNVREHGMDAKPKPASNSAHRDGAISVDETSLVYLGPNEIFCGPANLAAVRNALQTANPTLRPGRFAESDPRAG